MPLNATRTEQCFVVLDSIWQQSHFEEKGGGPFFHHHFDFFFFFLVLILLHKISICVCYEQREPCLNRHARMPPQLRLLCSPTCVRLLRLPTFFLACAVNVTRFHAMCQANFLSVSSPCCSSIKQSYILKSNLSPWTSLMRSPPWLDWIVVYCFRNATSARSIRLWHIKQQSLYYKEHAVIVSGVLGARWEPGIFFFFLDREAHMVLCGLNF